RVKWMEVRKAFSSSGWHGRKASGGCNELRLHRRKRVWKPREGDVGERSTVTSCPRCMLTHRSSTSSAVAHLTEVGQIGHEVPHWCLHLLHPSTNKQVETRTRRTGLPFPKSHRGTLLTQPRGAICLVLILLQLSGRASIVVRHEKDIRRAQVAVAVANLL